MVHYPAYTTTVIGAHSVPRWYEALDRLVTLGQLSTGDLNDAQLRATQAPPLAEFVQFQSANCGERHLIRKSNQPGQGVCGSLSCFRPHGQTSRAVIDLRSSRAAMLAGQICGTAP